MQKVYAVTQQSMFIVGPTQGAPSTAQSLSQWPDLSREGLLPSLPTLRAHAPTMAAAKEHLHQWEATSPAVLQGKPVAKRSGRYPSNNIPLQ